MGTNSDYLQPTPTVYKILVSSTSRLVGEYTKADLVIKHAWPLNQQSTVGMRLQETPISRFAYVLAFNTPPQKKEPGAVVADYTHVGETICGYLSLLFGKRFDCHGTIEGNGLYRVPDLTAYNTICDPQLPFNSHTQRQCFPVVLNLEQFSSIDAVIGGPDVQDTLWKRLSAACKFYMRALQTAESNPEIAYLHLITSGEILSSFFNFSETERLDEETLKTLEIIRKELSNGDRLAARLSDRLSAVKRSFVKSLTSLLDDDFFTTSESGEPFAQFRREDIETNIGAGYDLRSKYVHTGEPFGDWIRPMPNKWDIQVGQPVVQSREFRKVLGRAPTFPGLERLMRYCLLKFMLGRGVLKFDVP